MSKTRRLHTDGRERRRRAVLCGSLLCLLLAGPAGVRAADWAGVKEIAVAAGVPAAMVDDLTALCRESGLGPAEAERVAAPICAAARAGLPLEPLVLKTREGLSKRMPAPDVSAAVERRRSCLAAADSIIRAHVPDGGARGNEVVAALGVAMESGLTPDVAATVVSAAGGASGKQLAAVLEGGEALVLSGFAPEEVEAMMLDYLRRNMRRSEILRASRYALRRRENGAGFPELRRSLWGKGGGDAYGHAHGQERAGMPPGGSAAREGRDPRLPLQEGPASMADRPVAAGGTDAPRSSPGAGQAGGAAPGSDTGAGPGGPGEQGGQGSGR